METLNEQHINRKNYKIHLRLSSEFDGRGKMVATGDFYLYLQASKGKVSLGKEAIESLAKALEEIGNGKILLTNEKPCVVTKHFRIFGYKRYIFNNEGQRVREGKPYVIIENPAGRKVVIDGNDVMNLSNDLEKLKLE